MDGCSKNKLESLEMRNSVIEVKFNRWIEFGYSLRVNLCNGRLNWKNFLEWIIEK